MDVGKSEKRIRIRTIILAMIVLTVILYALFVVLIYAFPLDAKLFDNNLAKKLLRISPVPAAVIGSDYVTLSDVYNRLDGVQKFYESQDFSKYGLRVDFSTDDGKKRLKIKEREVINKLIEDEIIMAEARKRNVIVSSEIVDQEVDRKLKEYGTEDSLKEDMARLYGWTMDDFKNNIVKPDLYKEKLAKKLADNNPAFQAAREKIEKAKSELGSGKKMEDVAREYSEGESAKSQGELGWFDLSQMVPEVAVSILTMEKGEISGIIQSPLGFHIVRIDDRKNENNKEMFKLSQVFVRTPAFPEWLKETEKNYSVRIPLKEYYWSTENQEVEFQDESMKRYEKHLRENPSNDPSIWL